MSARLAQARYASDAAQTVSPARLVTMLYDRLVVDLAAAEDAIRRDDPATTGDRIGRAQEILLELLATLDLEIWPQGEPLSRLYLWLVGELMQARLQRSPERVAQCRLLLEPLRDAWHEAVTGRPIGGDAVTGQVVATGPNSRAGDVTGAASPGAGATVPVPGTPVAAVAGSGPVISGQVVSRTSGPTRMTWRSA